MVHLGNHEVSVIERCRSQLDSDVVSPKLADALYILEDESRKVLFLGCNNPRLGRTFCHLSEFVVSGGWVKTACEDKI